MTTARAIGIDAMRRRMLPKYVSQFTDTGGKQRFRFRRTGQRTHYFQAPLGSEEFMAEYQACLDYRPAPAPLRETTAGTIDDLASQFYRSVAFNKAKPITRQKARAILDAFREGMFETKRGMIRVGGLTARGVEFSHLDRIIADKAAIHPFAAVNLRKQLKRMFKHAVKIKMRPDNPADLTEPLSQKTDGFHTWTEAEIAQYQTRHGLGTKARLALELFLWTAKRRSDGVRLGRQHIRDGCFYGRDEKTGKPSWIPIAPQLQAAIEAMPAQDGVEHLAFLVTEYGKPFSAKGFGNKMRQWCDEAGLPHCTTHGLRKAVSRRLAEAGIGNQGIKSITLHSDDREVATYTREASQRDLAKLSMGTLSAQHLANRNG
jgi:integrase